MIKILLGITLVGHIVLGISDCLMVYGKKGRMNFRNMTDNEKMMAEYKDKDTPLSYQSAALLSCLHIS